MEKLLLKSKKVYYLIICSSGWWAVTLAAAQLVRASSQLELFHDHTPHPLVSYMLGLNSTQLYTVRLSIAHKVLLHASLQVPFGWLAELRLPCSPGK